MRLWLVRRLLMAHDGLMWCSKILLDWINRLLDSVDEPDVIDLAQTPEFAAEEARRRSDIR